MCPVCGMWPTLENLEQTTKEKPAEVRIALLKFGGKVASPSGSGEELYKKKGRGKAPGYMKFDDVTAAHPELVAEMTDYFKARIKLFMGSE